MWQQAGACDFCSALQVCYANMQVLVASLQRLLKAGRADAHLQERVKAATEGLAGSYSALCEELASTTSKSHVLNHPVVKAMASTFGKLGGIITAAKQVCSVWEFAHTAEMPVATLTSPLLLCRGQSDFGVRG